MCTRRQRIVQQLTEYPCSVRDLARSLGMSIKDVVDDLGHIQRSVGQRLQISPAVCERCEHVVERGKRFTAPSRCPACKCERTSEPELWLEAE